MLVQYKTNYSRLISIHIFDSSISRCLPAIFLLIALFTSFVNAQTVESTQTKAQKVAVVVPSQPVDESVSMIEGKVVIIYDGDTIGIETKDYKFVSIRIHGIDAPEDKQGFGKEARRKLVDLIEGKDVKVIVVKKGEFDRYMGSVYLSGADVGLMQVKNGSAWHLKQLGYEQNSEDRRKYSAAEKKARTEKLGLWSENAPIPPWEFRGDTVANITDKKVVTLQKTVSLSANKKINEPVQQNVTDGVFDQRTGRIHFLGPRGGCYYVSDSGRKVYVKDKSLCIKQ